MLGGYRQVVTEEGFNLVNGLAQWVFIASNFIWLVGMTAVYLTEGGWLRLAGAVLSALCALLVFLILTGLGGPGLLMIVGSLVILLYFLNAYYGFRILAYQEEIVHRPAMYTTLSVL
jgi:hypothetical protein